MFGAQHIVKILKTKNRIAVFGKLHPTRRRCAFIKKTDIGYLRKRPRNFLITGNILRFALVALLEKLGDIFANDIYFCGQTCACVLPNGAVAM